MDDNHVRSLDFVDPLVLQAEKILAQRKTRALTIDPDLLGEPGWDILLSAFIAAGKGHACRIDMLAMDLHLSVGLTQRWIALLVDRDMLESRDNLVVLTSKAEKALRDMFKAQLHDLMREIGAFQRGMKANAG